MKNATYRIFSDASCKKVISTYISTIYIEVGGKISLLNLNCVRRNSIALFIANRKFERYRLSFLAKIVGAETVVFRRRSFVEVSFEIFSSQNFASQNEYHNKHPNNHRKKNNIMGIISLKSHVQQGGYFIKRNFSIDESSADLLNKTNLKIWKANYGVCPRTCKDCFDMLNGITFKQFYCMLRWLKSYSTESSLVSGGWYSSEKTLRMKIKTSVEAVFALFDDIVSFTFLFAILPLESRIS